MITKHQAHYLKRGDVLQIQAMLGPNNFASVFQIIIGTSIYYKPKSRSTLSTYVEYVDVYYEDGKIGRYPTDEYNQLTHADIIIRASQLCKGCLLLSTCKKELNSITCCRMRNNI